MSNAGLENNNSIVWETNLPLPLVARGKVRDIYAIGEDKLLMITTDRISAFDVVMPTPIPNKGCVLNQMSLFWFEKFRHIIANPVITTDVNQMGFDKDFIDNHASVLFGRSMLVYRAKPLPVECVVRGFLVGSGWKEYQRLGMVCGCELPPGLRQSEELRKPIFTPSTKATVGHDMNISFEEVVALIGEDMAIKVRDFAIRLYSEGKAFAKTRGIIIADTKFEFGIYKEKLVLIDEVLTPDSSRFWPLELYQLGKDQPSLDKQVVRDYLETLEWDKNPPGPHLPENIVMKTATVYRNVFSQLSGSC